MGITNIRYPCDMVSRCGENTISHPSCMLCVVPDIKRGLILDVSFSTNSDLSTWSDILHRGLNDQWIQPGGQVSVAAPAGFSIPKIQICPRLHLDLTREHPELAVFIVVQGRESAVLAKMVLKDDMDQLASQLFFEACNGLSVVFSGIMRKEDARKLGKTNLPFKKADKFADLFDKGKDDKGSAEPVVDQDHILVFC